MGAMLQQAIEYHDAGLCVIPVSPRRKNPALKTWEEFTVRRSTRQEIQSWFGNGRQYNIGIVHGGVSNNYITLDIDHDAGLWGMLKCSHPDILAGRLERSGGGEGYHVPLFLGTLPDFGWNKKHERPIGNKTWKTENGHLNIRSQFCQSVAPPSVHPSGGRYVFIQDGAITRLESLNALIAWLNELSPPPPPKRSTGEKKSRQHDASGTLIEAVQSAWSTLDVFAHFSIADRPTVERDGQIKLHGNGGLFVDEEGHWYNFSDEIGGHAIEAWGWCRFGSAYDRRRHFRQVLIEMAQDAGIGVVRFHQRGDERLTQPAPGDRTHWTRKHARAWGAMR